MKLNYDFSKIENCMYDLISKKEKANLNNLKKELNLFWKDKQCMEIIYTKNDKMFFGMCCMPIVSTDLTKSILRSSKKESIEKYCIEIDSRLLDERLGLNSAELTAILLHEIGHLVNNGEGIEAIRKATDTYVADTNQEPLSLSDGSMNILKFGIQQSLRVWKSIFTEDDNEFIADAFSVSCGYGAHLESAVHKISYNVGTLSAQIPNKFIALQWCIRLFTEFKFRKTTELKNLNKLYEMSPSVLEKECIRKLQRNISEMDVDKKSINEYYICESILDRILNKASSLYKTFKYSGVKGLEDDMYEYSIKVQNISDEEEALIVLRQINARISILTEYLKEEYNSISESDKKRYEKVLSNYYTIRDKLAKSRIYKNKYYGLFVQYPNTHDANS